MIGDNFGTQQVETGDAAKCPAMPGTVPYNKERSDRINIVTVNCANVETLFLTLFYITSSRQTPPQIFLPDGATGVAVFKPLNYFVLRFFVCVF